MAPWPRKLANFPIILIAVAYHYIEAACLWLDHAASNATGVRVLALIFHAPSLPWVIAAAATCAWGGFRARRKVVTLLLLSPQQLLLFLGAGGAVEAIWTSQFADGVARSQAFILVDQCPTILMTVFHYWAMVLIFKYAEDER
jgi:hypothetical protein